jgi:hypothetical protein
MGDFSLVCDWPLRPGMVVVDSCDARVGPRADGAVIAINTRVRRPGRA